MSIIAVIKNHQPNTNATYNHCWQLIIIDEKLVYPHPIHQEEARSLKEAIYYLTEFMRNEKIRRVRLQVKTSHKVRVRLRDGYCTDYEVFRQTEIINLSLSNEAREKGVREDSQTKLAGELRSLLKKAA